jgi:hypothetical protein
MCKCDLRNVFSVCSIENIYLCKYEMCKRDMGKSVFGMLQYVNFFKMSVRFSIMMDSPIFHLFHKGDVKMMYGVLYHTILVPSCPVFSYKKDLP